MATTRNKKLKPTVLLLDHIKWIQIRALQIIVKIPFAPLLEMTGERILVMITPRLPGSIIGGQPFEGSIMTPRARPTGSGDDPGWRTRTVHDVLRRRDNATVSFLGLPGSGCSCGSKGLLCGSGDKQLTGSTPWWTLEEVIQGRQNTDQPRASSTFVTSNHCLGLFGFLFIPLVFWREKLRLL